MERMMSFYYIIYRRNKLLGEMVKRINLNIYTYVH